MIRRPPRSTRTDTLFPYTTLFRSDVTCVELQPGFAHELRVIHGFADAIEGDFLALDPAHYAPFDAVIMNPPFDRRSEEHTSELQSLMRISYAVFCLKKKKKKKKHTK